MIEFQRGILEKAMGLREILAKTDPTHPELPAIDAEIANISARLRALEEDVPGQVIIKAKDYRYEQWLKITGAVGARRIPPVQSRDPGFFHPNTILRYRFGDYGLISALSSSVHEATGGRIDTTEWPSFIITTARNSVAGYNSEAFSVLERIGEEVTFWGVRTTFPFDRPYEHFVTQITFTRDGHTPFRTAQYEEANLRPEIKEALGPLLTRES